MTEGDGAPRSTVDRAIDVVARRSILLAVAAAVVVALAATALLGGFAEAEERPDPVPSLALGEWSATQPYSLRILGATRTDVFGYAEPDDGNEFLLVEVDALNTWDREVSRLRDALLLELDGSGSDGQEDGREPLEADRMVIVADETITSALTPRVPTRMVFLFEVPRGAVGDAVTLQLIGFTLFTEGRLITEDYWSASVLAQRASVPVVDAPHPGGDDA